MDDKVVSLHPEPHPVTQRDADVIAADLTKLLEMPVTVRAAGNGAVVTIQCADLDRLDRLCVVLMRPA